MYFPNNITLQYFFLDTYIGYFLQALPIALLASAVYGFGRFRKDNATPISKKLFSCAFICYITGLVCLVVGLDFMQIFWYKLIYSMDSGIAISWFDGVFDFTVDFFNGVSSETIGNFLMFLPFGILYPLSLKEPKRMKCVIKGLITVVVIEVLQPIFGRSFDMNDIILNLSGIVASTSSFFLAKKLLVKMK